MPRRRQNRKTVPSTRGDLTGARRRVGNVNASEPRRRRDGANPGGGLNTGLRQSSDGMTDLYPLVQEIAHSAQRWRNGDSPLLPPKPLGGHGSQPFIQAGGNPRTQGQQPPGRGNGMNPGGLNQGGGNLQNGGGMQRPNFDPRGGPPQIPQGDGSRFTGRGHAMGPMPNMPWGGNVQNGGQVLTPRPNQDPRLQNGGPMEGPHGHGGSQHDHPGGGPGHTHGQGDVQNGGPNQDPRLQNGGGNQGAGGQDRGFTNRPGPGGAGAGFERGDTRPGPGRTAPAGWDPTAYARGDQQARPFGIEGLDPNLTNQQVRAQYGPQGFGLRNQPGAFGPNAGGPTSPFAGAGGGGQGPQGGGRRATDQGGGGGGGAGTPPPAAPPGTPAPIPTPPPITPPTTGPIDPATGLPTPAPSTGTPGDYTSGYAPFTGSAQDWWSQNVPLHQQSGNYANPQHSAIQGGISTPGTDTDNPADPWTGAQWLYQPGTMPANWGQFQQDYGPLPPETGTQDAWTALGYHTNPVNMSHTYNPGIGGFTPQAVQAWKNAAPSTTDYLDPGESFQGRVLQQPETLPLGFRGPKGNIYGAPTRQGAYANPVAPDYYAPYQELHMLRNMLAPPTSGNGYSNDQQRQIASNWFGEGGRGSLGELDYQRYLMGTYGPPGNPWEQFATQHGGVTATQRFAQGGA